MLTFLGTESRDIIEVISGEFLVKSYGGNDRIVINSGSGIVHAGNGNDTITSSGYDGIKVCAGNGADLIFLRNGDDTISGGHGNDMIVSGGGDDTIILNPNHRNFDEIADLSEDDIILIKVQNGDRDLIDIRGDALFYGEKKLAEIPAFSPGDFDTDQIWFV